MTSSLEQCLLTKVHHSPGTMGLFSLCTHALGLFAVLCLKILCPLLSHFMWKGEGVGCLLLQLLQWNRNSFIVHLRTDQHCFRTRICLLYYSRLLLIILELIITKLLLIMKELYVVNLELSNQRNLWSVVAPHAPQCWKTEQLVGNIETAVSVAVWSAY